MSINTENYVCCDSCGTRCTDTPLVVDEDKENFTFDFYSASRAVCSPCWEKQVTEAHEAHLINVPEAGSVRREGS